MQPRTEARRLPLQGQVLAVKADTNEILVKHEDIPGFMPAMTMPYVVKDAAILKDRAPGDLITATLMVAPGKRLALGDHEDRLSAAAGDARTEIPAAAGVHLLKAGDTVPDTNVDRSGRRHVSLADWRGSPIVVSFIYTGVPCRSFVRSSIVASPKSRSDCRQSGS